MKNFAMLLLVCTIGVAFVAGCPTANTAANNAGSNKEEPKKEEPKKEEPKK